MSKEPIFRPSNSRRIIPSVSDDVADKSLVRPEAARTRKVADGGGGGGSFGSVIRSLLALLPIPPSMAPSCRWLTTSPARSSNLGRRVTGTIFGRKKGHVSFAVQEDPRSEPVLLLELATPTSALVKEMASGLVRIALECERAGRGVKLFTEPVWTMYCNGRRRGYAMSRTCGEEDWHVLRTVQTVSIGAGVIPAGGGGEEVMFMRARFERVVGNRDSEAFYMLNPEGNGGPELSIFLLRI